jgi:signal peptidase I
MFQPKYLKHAKLLHKGVTRFLHYKRDLLPAAKLEEITKLHTSLKEATKRRDKEAIDTLTKTINKTCEKALPQGRASELAENIEVFFVSIVIALGIRSYIAQPFQIPTSSMQPTLNGIIAQATDEDPRQGPLGWITGFLTGTTRLNVVSDHDGYVNPRDPDWLIEDHTFIFRPYCTLRFTDGHTITIKCPEGQLRRDLHLDENLKVDSERVAAVNPDMQPQMRVRSDGAIHVSKGQLLARGLVKNGDHVIVNKFAYHFRRPTRGEVFVFTTKNIVGIEGEFNQDGTRRLNPLMGSQHYIKRLVGVPGDHVDVESPELLINGEPAREPGIRRVIDQRVPRTEGTVDSYHGYSPDGHRTYDGKLDLIPATLSTNPRQYFAMGDNSYSSSDSRFWGPVPEQNLVGPGWFCYWPLTKHWGVIR